MKITFVQFFFVLMTIITKMFLINLNLFIKPLDRNHRNDNFFITVYLTNQSISILNKMQYWII
jgi:hypothetical protein